jgi:phosphoglucomutase
MNDLYEKWKLKLEGTKDEKALEMMTHDEREDAFSGNLSFGTGGLRGIMGLGTNRLNHHTITKVTHGLAKAIMSSNVPKSAGVAYDTRFKSEEFAKTVCETLSAFGVEVFTFDKPMPTPVLSHAIRFMNLGWGVCITASHNPQEYNGYKVYDNHGVQVTDRLAADISKSIDTVEMFDAIPASQNELIKKFDNEVVEAYIEKIVNFVIAGSPCRTDWTRNLVNSAYSPGDCGSVSAMTNRSEPYPFIYSALHGAGANAVPHVLRKIGFKPVCIQQNPDGAFGGLKTPNPEEPVVYGAALDKAKETDAKLILATDPDCDRAGVMVKTENGFELLNGNQIGALLIDYLAQTRGVQKDDNTTSCSNATPCGVVISTIVSGLLGELVAKEHGLEFIRLLTGFKYIGEYIVNLPDDKKFFFGYEESYGYLAGDGAKDKDAVIASALIVKMAAYYDKKRMTLFDRLFELSEKYGYCLESLNSINISQDRQKEIMSRLRSTVAVKSKKQEKKKNLVTETLINGVTRTEDYLHGINGLPSADVLKLYSTDCNGSTNTEAWAAIRPSGTEPKLKVYTGIKAETYIDAKDALEKLTEKILSKLGIK